MRIAQGRYDEIGLNGLKKFLTVDSEVLQLPAPISKIHLSQDLSHHANPAHLQTGPPYHRTPDFGFHLEELVQGARPPHARRHHGHADILGAGVRLGAE